MIDISKEGTKQMKLKQVKNVMVRMTKCGKIVLDQTTPSESNCTYLTLDQFIKIASWVMDHEDDINNSWNDGISLEGDANED